MTQPQDLLTTSDIAKLVGLKRKTITNVYVRRPGFPAPALQASQRTRAWRRSDVEAYFKMDSSDPPGPPTAVTAAEQSPPASRGSTCASAPSGRGGLISWPTSSRRRAAPSA